MSGPARPLVAAAVGLAAAGLTTLGLGLVLGLIGGPAVGVGDNADGARLYRVAGLLPDTPDGSAIWRGVVVTTFTTGHRPGEPTGSAAHLLGIAVNTLSSGPVFSLVTLAWFYVALTAVGAGLAAGALAAVAPVRALLVVPPLLPLVVVPWWSRFDLSTYSEPAGLLGAVWVVLGLVVLAGSGRTHRVARVVALGLLVAGGLTAATAKPAFLPIGAVAALACLTVTVDPPSRWHRRGAADGAAGADSAGARPRRLGARVAGVVAAALLVVLGAGAVTDEVRGQAAFYGAINTHHLVFTAIAPEDGPGVLARLAFPPAATAAIGESYYWAEARDIPGWDAALGRRPEAARADALAYLAERPGTAATLLLRGLSATWRPQLAYLPSAPRGTAPEHSELRTIYPETGPIGDVQQRYLDAIALPWLPAAVAGLAIVAGLASLRRRTPSVATGLLRAAAVVAVAAVGTVALAVLGDGFYELTKHVWLASYLLVVVVLLAPAALLTAGLRPRPARVHEPRRSGRDDGPCATPSPPPAPPRPAPTAAP